MRCCLCLLCAWFHAFLPCSKKKGVLSSFHCEDVSNVLQSLNPGNILDESEKSQCVWLSFSLSYIHVSMKY